MPAKTPLYEEDFYAWSQEQAAPLRAGKAAEADLDNIADEIESMGRTEKRELVSRLTVLLGRLVKWRFQPSKRGRSWRLSIKGQRLDIRDLLDENPSLKPVIARLDWTCLATRVDRRRKGNQARILAFSC